MSITKYGIYIAYPPTVDLRAEGLGRYLATFLKAASERKDVQFVLVCPSWSHATLEQLFDSENVPKDQLEIVSPSSKPYLLKMYEIYSKYTKRVPLLSFARRFNLRIHSFRRRIRQYQEDRLAKAYSPLSLLIFVLGIIPFWLVLLAYQPLKILLIMMRWVSGIAKRYFSWLQNPFHRLAKLIVSHKDSPWVLRLFDTMYEEEFCRMQRVIQKLKNVKAWYCPTAFWPAFNRINAPRLMCVPDVVLMDFPLGFSCLGGYRLLKNFENIQNAIRGTDHIVTYSATTKWKTLVDNFYVPASKVSVIHHAPNILNNRIEIRGTLDDSAATFHHCKTLLLQALKKSSNPLYCAGFLNGEVRFLFYASQFRPNKNVMTLLRAYEYLLRRRLLGHKLILTGKLNAAPEIQRFIIDHRLQNEVLCLHGLTLEELAACYKMADLAVNPSLSEGGCPFTFTEALSVGTPVVTARIPVTEEVLNAPELQEIMFFDPCDWKDMAERIEWALTNRDQLLEVQSSIYKKLSKRTWLDVVNEHLVIMDDIADSFTLTQKNPKKA